MTNTLNLKRGASRAKDELEAARELWEAIGQPDISFCLFFCSPNYDVKKLGPALAEHFGALPMLGCTTAGEISPTGYLSGAITGISIASPDFRVVTRRIDQLNAFDLDDGEKTITSLLAELKQVGEPPTSENTFAFLLVDGLSLQEERVVAGLCRGIGDIQLFGGSAGDEENFSATYLFHDGAFHDNAAVVALVQTQRPFHVFKTQHFVPSDAKLVVTGADPANRVVTEINGDPAGAEYARLVGLEVDKLTPMIFATYPVVVRLGGDYYVRSIQKVNEDGEPHVFLRHRRRRRADDRAGRGFHSEPRGRLWEGPKAAGVPELVIGCDCILRKLESEQKGIKAQISELMTKNNVIGFATYGEQFNAMHVNQTFTGVAIGAMSDGE